MRGKKGKGIKFPKFILLGLFLGLFIGMFFIQSNQFIIPEIHAICWWCECCKYGEKCEKDCYALQYDWDTDDEAQAQDYCESTCQSIGDDYCGVWFCGDDDDGGGGGGGGGGGNDECQVDSDCDPGCSCLAGGSGNYCYCPPSPTPPPNHNPSCNLNALPSSLTYDGRAYYDRNRNGARIQQDPTTHDYAIATSDPDGDGVTIASVSVSQPACLQATHDGSTCSRRLEVGGWKVADDHRPPADGYRLRTAPCASR